MERFGSSITSPYLNVDEAAAFLRVRKSRIYELVRHRAIPFGRNGRKGLVFDQQVLRAWVRDAERTLREWFGEEENFNDSESRADQERRRSRDPVLLPMSAKEEARGVQEAVRLITRGRGKTR